MRMIVNGSLMEPRGLRKLLEDFQHMSTIFMTGCVFISETFKRVAHLVSGVRLRDHIVDVVFKMFDENGRLSI